MMVELLIYIGIIVVIGGFVWLSFYLKRKREQAMAAFAQAQGWQPLIPDGATLGRQLPEALSGKGEDQAYDMAYSLKVGQSDAVIFQYQYVIETQSYDPDTHSERTERQTYSFGVLTFSTPHHFAPLYVQRHTFLSGLGGFEGEEKLQVEGDFNKHFEVYSPKGMEVEALSLLTPDVMALMEDAGHDFSVQVTGQSVSVFGDDKYVSPAHAMELVNYATQLAAKLNAKPTA